MKSASGLFNLCRNLGGAVGPLVVGYALEWWGSWQTPLLVGGAVYVVGGLLTILVNPRCTLVADNTAS